MNIKFGTFCRLVEESIKHIESKSKYGTAGFLADAFDVFQGVHDDTDPNEEHHLGFLVTELMGTAVDHLEDQIEELKEENKNLEKRVDDGVSEIEDIISRLEEAKSELESE